MHGDEDPYDDIPGTILFSAERSRQGFHLNMFCMSLQNPENRAAFKQNEAAYLERWPITEAQRQAVLRRDWNGMLRLGGNIYYTFKLAATDGLPFQHVAALMSGATPDEYAAMMLAGGRPIDGNRSKAETITRG
jgi:protocatechuate 4,5-dioxygenase alpha chain